MGLEKLLKKLHKHFDRAEDNSPAARCDRINELLEKLDKEKNKLEQDLAHENEKVKRKELDLELRIVSLELKKGLKRRNELKDKCK